MQKNTTAEIPVLLYRILKKETDEEHTLSMPELLAMLNEAGISADRRTVYRCLAILKEHGCHITFTRKGGKQGYYLTHAFTPVDIFLLEDALNQNSSLAKEESGRIAEELESLISVHQRKLLPPTAPAATKTDNRNVLRTITQLMQASAGGHPVEFRYFDIDLSMERKYRRSHKPYRLVPYAVVSHNGRYYCVFYDAKHEGFSNYRIDKMDHVRIDSSVKADPVPFSLEEHMRSSFDMYAGRLQTVTVTFDRSLASQVYDQFGTREVIISKITDTSFTANIRTAVTPTLISWLLMYYDRSVVQRPESLVDAMKKIADTLEETYNRGKE